MMLAPVALFVYNRPDHLCRTLNSLCANPEAARTDLIIFSDGPRDDASAAAVRAVREIISDVTGFGSVRVVARKRNHGLANSVIAGVTSIIERHGRVIVLEDDIITASTFLHYMNEALDRYATKGRVCQIAGYQFPADLKGAPEAFFTPITTSWGWATWARAWRLLDKEGVGLARLDADPALRLRFDLDGAYPYYDMLKSWKAGETDSWAIRFHLGVFLNNGVALHPRESLVSNIGLDGSGRHCVAESHRLTRNAFKDVSPLLPDEITVDSDAFEAIKGWLSARYSICQRNGSVGRSVLDRMKALTKRLAKSRRHHAR